MKYSTTFSGFSVSDIASAKDFYTNVLGLDVTDEMGGLKLMLGGDRYVFIYQRENHQAATFTILNFVVDTIDEAIDDLVAKGAVMERYDDLPAQQDDKGVLRGKTVGMGPNIAWFKDPSGNILSVLEE